MWRNPGYTMGCTEVPPPGSTMLPKADYIMPTDNAMRPGKSVTMSSFEINEAYLTLRDMKYLFINLFEPDVPWETSGQNFSFFAWVTSIERIATAGPVVRVNYSIDYWRTFAHECSYGSGDVRRCNNATLRRPSATPPRMWKYEKKEQLFPPGTGYAEQECYVPIVVYATVNSDNEPTRIDYLYWRASYGGGEQVGTRPSAGLREIFASSFYQKLGLSPTNVIGVFVSPVEPWDKRSTDIYTSGVTDGYNAYKRPEATTAEQGHTEYISGANKYQTLLSTFKTDDTHKTVIIDPAGTIVATLPWGRSCDSISAVCDVGTTAANLILNLLDNTETGGNYPTKAAVGGYRVSVPLMNAPVNKDGWSSYVLSGQRAYDKRNAEIQRNQSLVTGITGIATGAASGAVGSAMAGKGMGAGAIAGGIASGVGAGVNYFSQGYFNDEFQNEQDKLASNQAANVVINAGGDNWVSDYTNPAQWYIVEMIADDVSLNEYNNNIALNGYPVDMPFTDCSALITAGGPLQISNLMITSDYADLKGIAAIKGQLERGVRIQENNPNGYTYGNW